MAAAGNTAAVYTGVLWGIQELWEVMVDMWPLCFTLVYARQICNNVTFVLSFNNHQEKVPKFNVDL